MHTHAHRHVHTLKQRLKPAERACAASMAALSPPRKSDCAPSVRQRTTRPRPAADEAESSSFALSRPAETEV
eukprot:6212637-Pleurochrysis_carterae.AAC.1